MPNQRNRKIKNRKRSTNQRNRSKRMPRFRRQSSNNQGLTVHRRLVLYPDTNDSKWLTALAWFSSVALKLFSIVTSVATNLVAEAVTVASGTTILLGPGDFAACSPYAVPITTSVADKEVKILKAFPFERASLHHMAVKIVPSVDLGSRGGMYAVLLVKIDSIDAQSILESAESKAKVIIEKYSCDYDVMIRHPRAIMSPVTKAISLALNLPSTPHNIRVKWTDDSGFVNSYPSCALMISFSDMASKKNEISSNYTPSRSLFEVHLKGRISFLEPGDLVQEHDSNEPSMSCYTPKVYSSDSKNVNIRFNNLTFESPNLNLDLRKISLSNGIAMLTHYDRTDLIKQLEAEHKLNSFVME